jgi:hypothetical protein
MKNTMKTVMPTVGIKYYPATRAGTYSNVIAALQSCGVTRSDAAHLVQRARINGSPAVFADLGEGKGAVVLQVDGKAELWWALIPDELFDTDDEAWAFALAVQAGLSPAARQWAIFEYREPQSKARN